MRTLSKPIMDFITENTEGNEANKLALTEAFETYFNIYKTQTIINPCPGYKAFFRTFRGAAVIDNEGRVSTTDLLFFDADEFWNNKEEMQAVFEETKWSSQGTIFNDMSPLVYSNNRFDTALLDKKGVNVEAIAKKQIKSFEFIYGHIVEKHNVQYNLLVNKPEFKYGYKGFASLDEEDHEKLKKAFIADLNLSYEREMQKFVSVLDKDVILLMKSAGLNNPKAYNWIMGMDVDPSIRQNVSLNRTTVLDLFPLFYSILSKPYGDIATLLNKENPIDINDANIISLIAKQMNTSDGVISSLMGITVPAIGEKNYLDEEGIMDIFGKISNVDSSQMPDSPEKWDKLFACCELLDAMTKTIPHEVAHTILKEQLDNLDDVNADNMRIAARSFNLMLRSFKNNIARPYKKLTGENITNEMLAYMIIGEDGLSDIANSINTWKNEYSNNIKKIKSQTKTYEDIGYEWTPLLKKIYKTSNGMTFRIIKSRDELYQCDRSDELNLPISVLAGSCYCENKQIAVLQDNLGNPYGYILIDVDKLYNLVQSGEREVKAINEDPSFIIVSGIKGNNRPDNRMNMAIWDFTDALCGGSIKPDFALLASETVSRMQIVKERDKLPETLADYNINGYNSINKVWDINKIYLSWKYTGMSLEEAFNKQPDRTPSLCAPIKSII